jgi:hypothetical protein
MLTPYFALKQDTLPDIDFTRYVAGKDGAAVTKKIAETSITLLKNTRSSNNTRGLPLNKPKDLIRALLSPSVVEAADVDLLSVSSSCRVGGWSRS